MNLRQLIFIFQASNFYFHFFLIFLTFALSPILQAEEKSFQTQALTNLTSAETRAVPNEKPFKIFLDAGHGGKDNGVVHQKIREADIVLQFVHYLEQELLKKTQYEITLSRANDESISLEERVQKAHQSRADLLLSFHVNSTPDAKAQGIEMFFRYPSQVEDKTSSIDRLRHDLHELGRAKKNLHFARLVKESLRENEKTFGKTRILIKQAPFYVVTKTQIPSVLIELGFLTHPREREKLIQSSYREEIAQKLIGAIDLFVSMEQEFSDKLQRKSLD